MNDMLKKDITIEQEIHKQYEIARQNKDDAGKQAAREAHAAHAEEILVRGCDYYRVFQLAMDAMERGNEYIDLSDCIFAKEVEPMLESFRRAGVEHFTYSSTWSGAVEIAWLFTKNGCRLEGLMEINSRAKDIFTGEHEKVHGYLFSL